MSHIRFLVADSSQRDRQELAAAALQLGDNIAVVEATDGDSAVRALSQCAIHVALVSRALPGLDGGRFLDALARSGRRSLFALLANRLDERWAEVAKRINAYELLLKPVAPTSLARLLKAYERMMRPARVALACGSAAVADLVTELARKSRFDLSIDHYETGRQTLRAVQLRPYDLALVDLLPDLPPLEAVVQLSAQASGTRVILMGNEPRNRVQAAAAEFGVAAYLRKPFEVLELDAALHEAFGLWRPYLANALVGGSSAAAASRPGRRPKEEPALGQAAAPRPPPVGGPAAVTAALSRQASGKPEDPYHVLFEVRFADGTATRIGVDRALIRTGDDAVLQVVASKQESGDLRPGKIVAVSKIVSTAWLD